MKVPFTFAVFKENLAGNLYKNGAGARRAIGRSSDAVFPEEDRVKARALIDKKFGAAPSAKTEDKAVKVSTKKKASAPTVAPVTEKRKPGRPKGYSPKKAAEQKAKEAMKASTSKKKVKSGAEEVSSHKAEHSGDCSGFKSDLREGTHGSTVELISVLAGTLSALVETKERFSSVDFTETVSEINKTLIKATERVHRAILSEPVESTIDVQDLHPLVSKLSMNGVSSPLV